MSTTDSITLPDPLPNPRIKDITGQRFGRLTTIRFSHAENGAAYWLFACDCGNKIISMGQLVRSSGVRSCGCLSKEVSIAKLPKQKHGLSRTPEYKTWSHIMERCYSEHSKYYKDYGGRGIKVCERWHQVENFVEDMEKRPGPEYSIDRIDVNGDYERSNCRWATKKEQANNRRSNVTVTFNNETHNLTEWAKILGISMKTISARMARCGWSAEKALSIPARERSVSKK